MGFRITFTNPNAKPTSLSKTLKEAWYILDFLTAFPDIEYLFVYLTTFGSGFKVRLHSCNKILKYFSNLLVTKRPSPNKLGSSCEKCAHVMLLPILLLSIMHAQITTLSKFSVYYTTVLQLNLISCQNTITHQ